MATTRRSFFGWLFGAAAVAPALPAIAEAAAVAAASAAKPAASGRFLMLADWASSGIFDKNPLLDDLPCDLPIGTQVRVKMPEVKFRLLPFNDVE